MKNNLKETNIEKNKEFNRVAYICLIISSAITLIAFIPHNSKPGLICFLISLAITIGLFFWTFSGGECPKCAARKHEKRLSTDLVSETLVGYETKNTGYHGWTNNGSPYKNYAVLNRKYNYHSKCKYCGYEWRGTFTSKEKEEL